MAFGIGNLKPARNTELKGRLVFLGVSFLLTIVTVSYLLNIEKNIAIDFARKELAGNHYLHALRILYEDVQQHQMFLDGSFSPGTVTPEAISAKRAEIEEDLKEILEIDRGLSRSLETADRLRAMTNAWNDLKWKLAGMSLKDIEESHARLIAEIRGLITQVGDKSNLILDPDLDSYYLMSMVLLELPETQSLLFQTMRAASRAVSDAHIPKKENVKAPSQTDPQKKTWAGAATPVAPKTLFFSISDEEAWKRLWPKLSAKPVPRVDFAKDMIVGVVAGPASDAEDVALEEFRPASDMTVGYRFIPRAPSPDGKKPRIKVPYRFAAIARTALKVKFEKVTESLPVQAADADSPLAVDMRISDDVRTQLTVLSGNFRFSLDKTRHSLQSAMENNPSNTVRPALEAPFSSYMIAMEGLLGPIQQMISGRGTANMSPDMMLAFGQKASRETFALWDKTFVALDALLKTRISHFETQKRIAFTIILFMVALTVMSSWVIMGTMAERNRALEDLQKSEEKLGFSLKSASIGTWSWSIPEKSMNWDNYIYPLFGLEPGTSLVKFDDFLSYIHPDQRERVKIELAASVASGNECDTEFEVVWPDLSEHSLALRGRVYRDGQGRTERMAGVCWDITAQKKMKTQFLQSQKMAAVGQLAAGVAHEINNPLGVILGFAEGMVGLIGAGDVLEMPVKSIEREAMRCKVLVENLLTFARTSQSNQIEMDVNKTIEQALVLIQPQAKIGRVKVSATLAEALPPIMGNRSQIEQVIMNLAKNAIDAMPNGGSLTLSSELLEHASRSWVCMKFTDDGTGIPPGVLSKIFDPFFTTKPVGQGTGLGLSLVSEIVEKHSGEISVESVPGRTVFTVKLPAHGRAAPLAKN
jgi:signal transduction histidine kinase